MKNSQCTTRPLVDSDQQPQHAETSSTGGAVATAVVLFLLLCIAALCIVLYYRRVVKRLKRELATVVYSPESSDYNDTNHFDNPVYEFSPPVETPKNVKLLNNDLTGGLFVTLPKNSNWEKQKLSEDFDDFAEASVAGSSSDSHLQKKIREADSTVDDYLVMKKDLDYRPNIYESIDDIKSHNKDPFYCKLNHKPNSSVDVTESPWAAATSATSPDTGRSLEQNADLLHLRMPPPDFVGERGTKAMSSGSSSGNESAPEYDHLDRNRPKTEVHPHYYKMASNGNAK